MTNVKLYDNCDGFSRPACLHCWCSITSPDYITFNEVSSTTVATPSAGEVVLFGCTDNKLYSKDSDANFYDLTSCTGGGTAFWIVGTGNFICPCNSCDVFLTTSGCYCSSSVIDSPCVRDTLCQATLNGNRWTANCIESCKGFDFHAASNNTCFTALTHNSLCAGFSGRAWKAIYSNAFNGTSDANCKENFEEVNYKDLKNNFDGHEITTWKWKKNNEKRIGSTYQNFKKAYSKWTTAPTGGISLSQQNAVLDGVLKSLLLEVKQLELELA